MSSTGVINYVDDCIIPGGIFEVHLENLIEALTTFENAGLLVKIENVN